MCMWRGLIKLNLEFIDNLFSTEMQINNRLSLTRGLIGVMVLTSLMRLADFIALVAHHSNDSEAEPQLLSVVPFANQSALVDTHIIMDVVAKFLHVAEYICFGVGLCKAITRWPKIDEKVQKNITNKLQELVTWYPYLLLILPLAVVGVGIIPVVQTVGDMRHLLESKDHESDETDSPWQSSSFIIMVITHGVLVGLVHFFTCVIRYVMILTSIAIHVIWKAGPPDLNDTEPTEADIVKQYIQKWNRANCHYVKLVEDYECKGEMVVVLNQIFQSWFFWQWFIYFIVIIADLTRLIDPNLAVSNYPCQVIFLVSCTIYDIMAFAIPYFCGLKMNSHHTQYYNELREKQREDKAFGQVMRIRLRENFNFVPTFFGITIPLNSPGYIITIILAIFAVVSNFLVADKS